MKLLGKKLYRIRPIKLSKGGFGGGPATGGMDFSKILPPAPPPLGERADSSNIYRPDPPMEPQPWEPIAIGDPMPTPPPGFVQPPEVYNPLTKYGQDLERKVMEEFKKAPRPRDVPPPEVHAQRERELMNRIRQENGMPPRELDPNSHQSLWRPGPGSTEPDPNWKPGERPNRQWQDTNEGLDAWLGRPPTESGEYDFEMPNDEPGYEITPDPVPPGRYEQGWNKPVEEMQWMGSHDPFGDEMPDHTPRPPNMVEKPSGIVQPDLEAGLGDTKPGLSNWVSPVDDGRVDAPGYVVGGGESPQPSPGGGAGEIEKLRAQIKQLQATIAELRSKQQQPASRPPEQAPRPEMPMGGGFGGGGFFGR